QSVSGGADRGGACVDLRGGAVDWRSAGAGAVGSGVGSVVGGERCEWGYDVAGWAVSGAGRAARGVAEREWGWVTGDGRNRCREGAEVADDGGDRVDVGDAWGWREYEREWGGVVVSV